jgi:hypothetical protein
MKKRFLYIILILLTLLILGAIWCTKSAEGNKKLFDGRNEFNEKSSYIIDGAYWEVSFGNSQIEWGNNIVIPHDAGYIGLFRQTMSTFLMEYSINPFSYGQRNTFKVPDPANKYMAIYIRSATFKLDSFMFLKDNSIVGTLGAYSEAVLDKSTTNYDSTIDVKIYEETDRKFAQLGTGSDTIYSCIVYKFSKNADFDKIQMVILP